MRFEISNSPLQISLVVPVRDEELSLARLVSSVRAQTRQPDEVILVDGGSNDRTVALARELFAGDERFRVVEAGPASPGRGRNVGAGEARYPWVAFTDAGIGLEAEWLERLAEKVSEEPETDVVYGNFEPLTRTFFERCAAVAYVPPKVVRDGETLRGPSIASTLIRREVWRRAGGFPDLRAAEDLIFMERVAALGARTRWAPGATVWWQLQPTLALTFRKFALYSKHNVWAGRQRFWHYGVARQYALAAPFFALAALHSVWWLAVPLLGLAARAGKSVWRHRDGRGLLWALNPAQLACVALLILTIDLATFVGWARALLTRADAATAEQGTVA
ncbi:MAG: glycosyltransferase [Acidobacteria bacterium]|nr:glycosyltransferase [Acidobacteriota bacterium]